MKQKTAILVLGAGEAKRMGTPKQLLPFAKTTLLAYCLNTAIEANLGRVYCVLGAHFQQTFQVVSTLKNVSIIKNENWQNGLGSSITSGLKGILTFEEHIDFLLIVLADQPLIPANHFQQLMSLAERNAETTIATKYPKSLGVPAVFPRSVLPSLLNLKAEGGAKKILENSQNILGLEIDQNLLYDIDTPSDYQIIT